MGGRRAALVAAIVALAAIAALVWHGKPAERLDGATAVSSAQAVSSAPASQGSSMSPQDRGTSQGAADEEWKAADLPAVAARRLAAATDKRAFYDRAVSTGGGAHLMQAAEALDQCAAVGRFGMVGAEQMAAGRGIAAERLAAFREQIKGCEGFETRKLEIRERDAILKRAGEQQDLVSRAIALRPDTLLTPEAQTGAQLVALQALATGDAYLLTELAQYFAFRQAGLLGAPRIGSSADPRIDAMLVERDAWIWAGCELGVDCGPASANGRRVCIEMAKCDWKKIDDIAAEVFGDTGKASLRERKDAIVAAVRGRDWAKLGF